MRTLAVLVFAALVGVAGGLAFNAWPDGSAGPPVIVVPATVDVPPTTATVTAESVAGGIRIVESGFSTADETGCAVEARPCPSGSVTVTHHVTFGIVVENTGDEVALAVPVDVTFVDGAGLPVTGVDAAATGTVIVLDRLAPGETTGIGSTQALAAAGAAEMRVAVQPPADWMSLDHEATVRGGEPVRVSADAETVVADGRTVQYTATLASPDRHTPAAVSAVPSFVLRNEQRAIVGGGTDATRIELPPGDGLGDLTLPAALTAFPFVADAHVDVYFHAVELREVRPVG